MGERARNKRPVCTGLPFGVPLLVALLVLPTPALSFDLASLLSSLGMGKQPAPCPTHCNCTTRRAEDVMQDYVSQYVPYMGGHMRPGLERQARGIIRGMTAWIGSTADIQCHLPADQQVNLTDVLQASVLSFKALRLTCDPGAGVVWDVSAFNAFVNILDVSGCQLFTAEGSKHMAVPLNLWVLDLRQVQPEAVHSLDFSTAVAMLALSITDCNLVSLPQHWSKSQIHQLMFLRLAHNSLSSYECQVKTSELTSLNLDHNNLTNIPPCVLRGSRYTNHVSLRHNHLNSLGELLLNKSEEEPPPTPQLRYLDLSYNQLTALRAIRKVNLFFGLDLSHNRISTIALDTFMLHPTVEWLDLSNNHLEHVLDGVLSDMVMINHLNLSHNRLRSFGFDQSPLSTKVATLDLRHNRLTYPPFADTGYVAPRLSRITAANNPFTCDCTLRVFLQFLSALNSTREQNWFALGYWDNYEHDPSINQPFVDTEELTCSKPVAMKGEPLSSLSFKTTCPLLRGCPTDCTCQLVKGDTEHVSVNCSDNPRLKELPNNLPMVSDTPIVLYVNHTSLRRLEYRPYLHLVTELHASNSKVSSVTPGAMQAMQNITVLALDHNQLKSLPAATHSLALPAATNISLGGNPWICSCSDLWMPRWLVQHADALHDGHSIRCRWTGKLVSKLDSSDLDCELFNYLPLVITLVVLLILGAVAAALLVKYRLEVLVFLYTRFRVRPFDMYKYEERDQPSEFDVFVSFSQHDYRWVVEKLVDQLENRARPYKLCIHLRDFPVGAPIADSVSWAVDNSRCTLLVLTQNFVASEWCRHEFRAAHLRLLRDRKAKLLIVLHGPLDARTVDRELLAYLRTSTYLRTEDKWFWSKLEYALPAPQEAVVMMGGAMGGARGGQDGDLAPPPIELDANLPAAMAAGDDVFFKQARENPPLVPDITV